MTTYGFTDVTIEFTQDELTALAKLADANSSSLPLDMRKMTRKVRDYAKKYGLIELRKNRWRTVALSLDYVYALDVRIVWELARVMIPTDGIGYSIVKDKRWLSLNISAACYKDHDAKDLERMQAILNRLDWFGFIRFNSAGSVWRIEHVEK